MPDRLKRNPEVVFRVEEAEEARARAMIAVGKDPSELTTLVLMFRDTVLCLNLYAQEIWRICAEPVTSGDILMDLSSIFELDAKSEAEVLKFIEELKGRGLLEIIRD
jgi:hypothetical protein